MDDPYDLQRFVDAQAPLVEQVRSELRQGHKRGHWMWFVFSQMKGLGSSPTSKHYAIGSREEAAAYLKHPVLGPRLVECTRLVLTVRGRTCEEIFGEVDSAKFRSSMTLFARAAEEAALDAADFNEALKKYFGGEGDPLTAAMLR